MELNAKVQAVMDLKRRNLNNLNQEIVYCNDIENIKSFVENNPAPEYCMRDLDSPMGQYFFAKDFEQIIDIFYLSPVPSHLNCVPNRTLSLTCRGVKFPSN